MPARTAGVGTIVASAIALRMMSIVDKARRAGRAYTGPDESLPDARDDGAVAVRAAVKHTDAWVTPALMATMLVWGLNFPVVKALTAYFDTPLMASLRMAVAAVTFALLLLWQRQRWPRCTPRQWAALAACAFTMVYLNQILFVGGMQRTGAANGALIMATAPMISGLLAALAFGERLHLRHLGAVLLGFGGVAVVVLNRPGAALAGAGWGDLMLVGCVITFALGGLIVQRLAPRIGALPLSGAVYTMGAAMLLVHLLLVQGTELSVGRVFPGAWPWLLIIVSAVLGTALANWVWNSAIGRIGVARTAVFVYWVPVFGMGFSALLLGEPLNAWYGLGLLMVLGGSRLAQRTGRG